MGIDICCILFHLVHFMVRLALRHSGNNIAAEDAALNKVRFSLRKKLKKVRRFFGGRTEQFEMFAFLIAAAMLTENAVFMSNGYGTARFCRCFRVVYLVDAQVRREGEGVERGCHPVPHPNLKLVDSLSSRGWSGTASRPSLP